VDQRTAAQTAGRAILDKLPSRGIHFDSLIHSIHTGENLQFQKPFIVYGFGGSPTFLDEVRFPGTTADCAKCHVGNSNTIEAVPSNAAPTQSVQVTPSTVNASGQVTTGGQVGTLQPISAACLSCHDTTAAHAHVSDMTQGITAPQPPPNPEVCSMCHGQSGPVSVTRVHAEAAR
jgi:OmcA/MtrC family decaheme c-type cytochrome